MRHVDENIGQRIAQARREAGLTQAQLAEALDITRRSIQGYEAGKVVPYRHLDELAAATGRSRGWLLRGESEDVVTALGAVGQRLVALVEQIADEAERIADAAARLEARLDAQRPSPRARARA
jgi:transcriptional regulator with XRE-family HTH domain